MAGCEVGLVVEWVWLVMKWVWLVMEWVWQVTKTRRSLAEHLSVSRITCMGYTLGKDHRDYHHQQRRAATLGSEPRHQFMFG